MADQSEKRNLIQILLELTRLVINFYTCVLWTHIDTCMFWYIYSLKTHFYLTHLCWRGTVFFHRLYPEKGTGFFSWLFPQRGVELRSSSTDCTHRGGRSSSLTVPREGSCLPGAENRTWGWGVIGASASLVIPVVYTFFIYICLSNIYVSVNLCNQVIRELTANFRQFVKCGQFIFYACKTLKPGLF